MLRVLRVVRELKCNGVGISEVNKIHHVFLFEKIGPVPRYVGSGFSF